MKFIPVLILSIFLSGCIFPLKPDEPTIPRTEPAKIEKAALEPCPLLKEGVVVQSFQEVLVEYSDLAAKYSECANKQNNSIKIIKKFGAIE